MGTTVKTIRPADDPLGYEGDTIARVRAMAEDALARVNQDRVDEEAAILRSRLGFGSHRSSGHGPDPRR
jgi:hypothetical protein